MLNELPIHLRESIPCRDMKQILCPTDLSQDSDKALRYAIALAKSFHAKLFVCYCVEKSHPQWQEHIDGTGHIKGLFEESIGPYVSAADTPPLEWQSLIAEGDAAKAITQEATNHDIDLIVMNSRRRPFVAALLGSTAESVCRTATCPVLVTHTPEREWIDVSAEKIELKRILIAYDFTDYAKLALAYALSFAQQYHAEVHLLHVLQTHLENTWYPPNENTVDGIARHLHYLVPAEVQLSCEVKPIMREGTPHREILSYAEAHSIDLICLGAHGKAFTEWQPFGSNTDRVLRQAQCPVFVARHAADIP